MALPGGPTVAALNADLGDAPLTSLPQADFDTPISAAAAASNRRTAQSLAGSRDVGDLPAFVVSALKAGSESAPAEVADLFAQTRIVAPHQAERLKVGIAEIIGAEDAVRFDTFRQSRTTRGPEHETAPTLMKSDHAQKNGVSQKFVGSDPSELPVAKWVSGARTTHSSINTAKIYAHAKVDMPIVRVIGAVRRIRASRQGS